MKCVGEGRMTSNMARGHLPHAQEPRTLILIKWDSSRWVHLASGAAACAPEYALRARSLANYTLSCPSRGLWHVDMRLTSELLAPMWTPRKLHRALQTFANVWPWSALPFFESIWPLARPHVPPNMRAVRAIPGKLRALVALPGVSATRR